MLNVEHLNAAFPKYPITVRDKGWVYGVWYCSTAFKKTRLHGEYPATFLKRALALFPNAKDVLHAPSGTLTGLPAGHVTLDGIRDDVRCPDIVSDCASLPFPDNSFDLVLSDPPYTAEDSRIYGFPPFPMGKFMREARRVLRPGGYFGLLHVWYPSYRRSEGWDLQALIAVITGFSKRTRVFSVFQNNKNGERAAGEI